MARTAEVKRDARIGEAEAKKDARIKEAMAEEEKMAARFVNDTEIAKAQRDFEIKKATYDAEVETKVGESCERVVKKDKIPPQMQEYPNAQNIRQCTYVALWQRRLVYKQYKHARITKKGRSQNRYPRTQVGMLL